MICPQCSSADIRVIDSRTGRDGRSIRRRRQCNGCGARFTTLEEIIREGIVVVKRDGSVEDFDQSKIQSSLKKVFEKRPIESERQYLILHDIIRSLESEFDAEIPSRAIAEQVMNRLKGVDDVAYVRFASHYVKFSPSSTVKA
ncbi:MAG: transcriptional regulator NrdR [Opitutales bacterium]|nr:transcriptional regulator NrdR [Opitutales bacterium]